MKYDATPVIPNRARRVDPWPWDEEMAEQYRGRNRVERLINKPNAFRRIATPFEKLKETDLAFAQLVFGFIHVKKHARFVNTA